MNHHVVRLLIGALSILGIAAGRADTIVLNSVADTTLFQNSPDNNLGATPNMIVGRGNQFGATNRALVRFDLSGIPPLSTIHSAALVLTDISPTNATGPASYQLYRMLVSWDEGTGTGNQGTPALQFETTWNSQFHEFVPWSVPGTAAGVHRTNVSSGTGVLNTNTGQALWNSTPELLGDVRRWISNSALNHGWIVISDEESVQGSSRRFATRENTQGRGPKLLIEFTPRVELISAADTSLFENNTNNNLGGQDFMPVGRTYGGKRGRGLLQFNIAGTVPSNAVVISASLNLKVTLSLAFTNHVHNLHRVIVPWGEGTGSGVTRGTGVGSFASPGEATWLARQFQVADWAAPGAAAGSDYLAAPSASQGIEGVNTIGYDFSSPELLADVQLWLDTPATNFGWFLINTVDSSTDPNASGARRIGSREDAMAQPRLALTYTVPPTSGPPEVNSIEATPSSFQFRFMTAPGRSYIIERRSQIDAGSWSNHIFIGVVTNATNQLVTDPVGPGNSFYRVHQY